MCWTHPYRRRGLNCLLAVAVTVLADFTVGTQAVGAALPVNPSVVNSGVAFGLPRVHRVARRGGRHARPVAPLPPIDTREADTARQDLADADARLKQRQAEFDRIGRELSRDRLASPELKAANAALARARATYQAAARRMTERLAADGDYRAALAAKADADQRRKAARAGSGPPAELAAAARASLEAAAVLSRLRAQAEAAAPEVVDARARVAEAYAALKALREDAQGSLARDPAWLAARSAVDDARRERVTASRTLARAESSLASARARRQDGVSRRGAYGRYAVGRSGRYHGRGRHTGNSLAALRAGRLRQLQQDSLSSRATAGRTARQSSRTARPGADPGTRLTRRSQASRGGRERHLRGAVKSGGFSRSRFAGRTQGMNRPSTRFAQPAARHGGGMRRSSAGARRR